MSCVVPVPSIVPIRVETDGERRTHIRTIATRARKFILQIRKDLELLEKFLQAYDGG